MNRRDALSRVALILGGTVIGANIFLEGCKPADKRVMTGLDFQPEDVAYLDEIADTILPTTASSPGAKAAAVGTFMTVMVKDCYDEADQKIFTGGMQKLQDACKKKNDNYFMECTPQQRHDLLVELDNEQKEFNKDKKKEDPQHYFRMIKELTLLGYFTSEIGATKALRYVESPGRFEACIPYKKGDKAWAL
ncbi:MAG: gluconate 2-dehydrogenase subunit 3 family protein [Chitinophagaceae bacterium]|nr:gluconate 2-dehydrogenase subunit 3 family protein [Chitinophagaceae bacterium]